jgi:hypothetical protein
VELTLGCMRCLTLDGRPSGDFVSAPYYEDRVTIHTCSKGHENVTMLQSHKFEVLLESGANALLAGFTVEAATSTAAALERYFEFALQALLTHRGMNPALYAQMFKEMSSQSERQLGAFMAQWAQEFGEAYSFPKDYSRDRNRVVHKGHMPTPEECRDFCGVVYGEIFGLQAKLRARCQDAINQVVMQDLVDRRTKIAAKVGKEAIFSTTTGTMFYSIANTQSKDNYADALTTYAEARKMMSGLLEMERVAQTLHESTLGDD